MVDVNKISPQKNSVIIKVKNLEELYDELVTPDVSDKEEVAIRFGEVISIGPDATTLEQCPDLKVGDTVVFTEFAGYFIATEGDDLCKVLRGYDIIGKFMNNKDIEKRESAIPTGNRILAEMVDTSETQDGVILNAKDPRLADLSYGKILKVNPLINKLGLEEGQLVAFPPYVGTIIRNYESEEKKELKMIVEEDILFTV
jgi:co-chaperonin GroES (HSP10)